MINYRHNHTLGINPHAAQRGVSSLYREYGVGMPGRLSPIQGDSTPILTQVIEWPWEEDDAGVAFDTANIWGVRTRCQLDGGGGEVDRWVAVPRTLPVGYTPVGRHGRIVPLIADHLGENPMNGRVSTVGGPEVIWPVRWRTPTGQYPTDLEDDGYLWVPMNLNQQTVDASAFSVMSFSAADNSGVAAGTGPIGFPPACLIPYTTGPNLWRDWGYNLVGEHVGFRGGKLSLYAEWLGFCAPAYSGNMRVVIGWDSATPATNALPPNIVFDQTYAVGSLNVTSAVAYNWRWDLDVTLPALLSTLGTRRHWIVWLGSCQTGDAVVDVGSLKLSPRNDIPLWYWSSSRNRIAPGGVVA